LAARFGNVAEREAIVGFITSSLADSTAEKYGYHFARFERWCKAQPDQPSPLPASRDTVIRWIASDVCPPEDIGRVKADNLRPYTAAINTVHRDFELPEPAEGHLWRAFKKGLKRKQAQLPGRKTRRVYLPPDVVEQVLLWALAPGREQRCIDAGPCAKESQLFRAAVAMVFTFCFFARGGTGAALLDSHVRRSAAGVTVTLATEKGKDTDDSARTLTLPPGCVPGLEQLLDSWERVRGPVVAAKDSYYAFAAESKRTFPSTQIDTWVSLVLKHLGAQPPEGETWSGHSLRKGAASGANSIDVSLTKICHMGGWSILRRAVHDYIDPTCPATRACWRFFGWLAPRRS